MEGSRSPVRVPLGPRVCVVLALWPVWRGGLAAGPGRGRPAALAALPAGEIVFLPGPSFHSYTNLSLAGTRVGVGIQEELERPLARFLDLALLTLPGTMKVVEVGNEASVRTGGRGRGMTGSRVRLCCGGSSRLRELERFEWGHCFQKAPPSPMTVCSASREWKRVPEKCCISVPPGCSAREESPWSRHGSIPTCPFMGHFLSLFLIPDGSGAGPCHPRASCAVASWTGRLGAPVPTVPQAPPSSWDPVFSVF